MIGVREPVNVSSSDRRQLELKPADGSSCTGPSPRTMRYPSLSVRDQSDNWKTTWYDRRDFRSTECSNVLPVSGMHGLVWYDCIFTQVYIFISWPVLVKSHASGWDAMLNTIQYNTAGENGTTTPIIPTVTEPYKTGINRTLLNVESENYWATVEPRYLLCNIILD